MTLEIPDVILIGGGGHARVLVDTLRCSAPRLSVAVLDSEPSRVGQMVLDTRIIGDDAILPALKERGTKYFAVAMGGARGAVDNRPRALLFERIVELGLEPLTIVHPSAVVSKWAEIGAGCQLLPGSIVNAGARLGRNVIVNSGAVVEHDCSLADHTHVATGARLASTISIGARAHIGAGAVVRQLITIGADSIVAAGAVVVKNVSEGAVVAGVPAKELGK